MLWTALKINIESGENIESDLGKLVSFIKETDFTIGDNPPLQYDEIAFNYVYSLIARSPSFQKEIKCHSIFFQFISEINQHDCAAHDGYILTKEKNILRKYRIAFLDNKSLEELILPTGGIIQVKDKLILPVTPWRAIVLENICNEERKNHIVNVYECVDIEEIHAINKMAFLQEMDRDKKYVISSDKGLLQSIFNEINIE